MEMCSTGDCLGVGVLPLERLASMRDSTSTLPATAAGSSTSRDIAISAQKFNSSSDKSPRSLFSDGSIVWESMRAFLFLVTGPWRVLSRGKFLIGDGSFSF